jgi:hypothetical protein
MNLSAMSLLLHFWLFQIGQRLSIIESDILRIPSLLLFYSRCGPDAMAMETALLVAAIYYGLLALPLLQVIEVYWKGSEASWRRIYATSLRSAAGFICIMWILLIPVHSTMHTICAF